MLHLKSKWEELTYPRSQAEEDARQEKMTRVTYLLVGTGLAVMTIVVAVVDIIIGEPSITPVLAMLVVDALLATGWVLISKNAWQVSRALPPLLFLGLAIYLNYLAGAITMAVAVYAIAALLAGMLFGNRVLWIATFSSIGIYLVTSWLSGERDPELFLVGGFTFGFAISGIATLQWYASHLLAQSLRQSQETAKKLSEANQRLLDEIVERKETEAALLDSTTKTRAILEAIRDGVMITDLQGTVLDLNESAVRLHGYSHRHEIIGQRALDLAPSHQHAQIQARLGKIMQQGYSELQEFKFVTRAGKEFDGEVNLVLLKDAVGVPIGFVALTRDISERKHVEAERLALIEKLKAANAELEQFTYTVSHDLKSPLVTITGFLGYIEQDAVRGDIEGVKRSVLRVNEAAGKMQTLLNELLELSRIGRIVNKMEEIPFGELAQESIARLEGTLRAGRVRLVVENNLPVVWGDRTRLVQVMQNLIDNAIKFMGNQATPLVQVGMRQENGEQVLFVKDNGIGIETQYHDKVFGLFEKLDPGQKGTGVGLALVKRIIEVHGGRIWVESEAGKGATFCFTLGHRTPGG